MTLGLLQKGREQVADLRVLPLSALHVQHGGLQHATECRRLLGLALFASPEPLDRFVEVEIEVPPEAAEVHAARGEDAFAVAVVCERIQQVLEGQVRVLAGDGLAKRDVQDDFDGCREHQS
jgi:hypothetical protein